MLFVFLMITTHDVFVTTERVVCPGGTLVFDEADIELQAENILIADGGKLQIGQEGAPFQHKAIITLHGNLRSQELPVYGTKTLAVREGILDLHGRTTDIGAHSLG